MAHHFKKQFGQNFLRSARFTQALVSALQPQAADVVIEIGPGEGHISNLLLEVVDRLTCVEVDYQLVPKLIERFGDNPKFNLVHGDIMQQDIEVLTEGKSYKVIGSLPYNISKQIIAKFLTAARPPLHMAFIIQEEVAWEYVAQPPKGTFLSNWANLYAEVHKLVSIPASQFFPKPKVNGGIITFTPHTQVDSTRVDQMHQLLRLGFSSPRKTLRNNLGSGTGWDKQKLQQCWQELNLPETLRPAETTTEVWDKLWRFLYNVAN